MRDKSIVLASESELLCGPPSKKVRSWRCTTKYAFWVRSKVDWQVLPSSTAFVLAILFFCLPLRSADAFYHNCPSDLECRADEYEQRDRWLARYPELEHEDLDVVYFCQPKEFEHLSRPISDTKIIGFDEDCNKAIDGQYDGNAPTGEWIFYDTEGRARKKIAFHGDKRVEYIIGNDSTPLRLDNTSLLAQQETAAEVAGQVDAQKRDMYAYAVLERGSGRICSPYPDLSFDFDKARSTFEDQGLRLSYDGVSPRGAVFISVPILDQEERMAVLYYLKVGVGSCTDDESPTCDVRVIAERKVAPVAKDVIKLSEATSEDDSISEALLRSAASIVTDAAFWCDWRRPLSIPNPFGGLF